MTAVIIICALGLAFLLFCGWGFFRDTGTSGPVLRGYIFQVQPEKMKMPKTCKLIPMPLPEQREGKAARRKHTRTF